MTTAVTNMLHTNVLVCSLTIMILITKGADATNDTEKYGKQIMGVYEVAPKFGKIPPSRNPSQIGSIPNEVGNRIHGIYNHNRGNTRYTPQSRPSHNRPISPVVSNETPPIIFKNDNVADIDIGDEHMPDIVPHVDDSPLSEGVVPYNNNEGVLYSNNNNVHSSHSHSHHHHVADSNQNSSDSHSGDHGEHDHSLGGHGSHDHGSHDHSLDGHGSHDHGSDGHRHLDPVVAPGTEEFSLTNKPNDASTEMKHSNKTPEEIEDMMTNSRKDKSLDDNIDLCAFCLCNPNETQVYCSGDDIRYKNEDKSLELSAGLIPVNAKKLDIEGFATLIIKADTFANEESQLQRITLTNIDDVQLQRHSLKFSQHSRKNMVVELEFERCNLPVIPSGTLTQMDIDRHSDSDHSHSHSLSLESTRFITLKMHKCRIDKMESHAFYQARIFFFNMTAVTIGNMSQKSIDFDVYNEWTVKNSNLPHLPRNAICIHADKSVVFSGNIIKGLDPYAWNIEAVGQVLFQFNTVKTIKGNAFLNIIPFKNSRAANIVFVNNTVLSGDPDALVTSEKYPPHERSVHNNRFHILCECNISTYFKEMLDIKENDTMDLLLYDAVVLDSLCLPYHDSLHYMYIRKFLDNKCTSVSVTWIVISTIVVTILLVSITVACVCAKKAKIAMDEVSYLGECSSRRSFSTMNTNQGPRSPAINDPCKNIFYDSERNPPWIMAVPDIKTYQETEVHVTYEESHPIQPSARSSYQDQQFLELERRNLTRQSCPFN